VNSYILIGNPFLANLIYEMALHGVEFKVIQFTKIH